MYPSYMNKPAFMSNTANPSFGAASTSTFGQPATNTSMFSSMQPSNIFQTPNTSSFNATPTAQSSFDNNANCNWKVPNPASGKPKLIDGPPPRLDPALLRYTAQQLAPVVGESSDTGRYRPRNRRGLVSTISLSTILQDCESMEVDERDKKHDFEMLLVDDGRFCPVKRALDSDSPKRTNLFGQQQQQPSTSGLFGGSNAFGQNKASFGFGAAPAQPGLFGQQPQQQAGSSLFQSNTPNLFGTNTFANQTTGTVIKFAPVTGTDTMQKNGVTQSISTKHHCITCMKEYESKSLEELRFEDYSCSRKGPQQQPGFGSTPFGAAASATPTSLFGQTENKQGFGQPQAFGQTPAFGQPTPAFGVTNQTSAPTIFGKPNTFGATTSTTPTFGFNAAPSTANPFSATQAQKPFAQPLFGAATTQAQPTFGTGVFGQTNAQNPTTNLFQKPAQPGTGFNAGQQGFSFTQPTTQASTLFQVSKPNTGFGMFGQTNTTPAFGQTTQPSFGTNFGKLTQPAFPAQSQPTFGGNLGGGLQPQQSLFGNAATKPNLFGAATSGGSLFGNNVFQQTPTPFSLNINQPPNVSFPPESTEDKNVSLVASDSFPDGPHFAGLEPVLSQPKSTTISAKGLRDLIDNGKKRDDTLGARAKIKVQVPKPKRGKNYHKDFFDETMNQQLRNSPRCLVIRNFNENDEKRTVYSKYKNALLEEAEACMKSSESDVGDFSYISSSSREYTPSETTLSESVKTFPVGFRARMNKMKLNFDTSIDDMSEQTGSKHMPPLVSPSPGHTVSTQCDINETKTLPVVPPLDLSENESVIEEEIPYTEFGEDSSVTTSTPRSAGVILTKPEYYVFPAINELTDYINDKNECVVQGLTIGRKAYGNVYFPDPIDITNMNFDEIVHFRHREVIIYPDDKKPPMGEGLNRRAQVTLDRVWPKDINTGKSIKDMNDDVLANFVDTLMIITTKHHGRFVEYRPKTGSWVFKVKHFSKYGFTESDDEMIHMDPNKPAPKKKNAKADGKAEQEVEEVPIMGLGGGSQLLKNRLISKEDSFVEDSTLVELWHNEAYTDADEIYPTESSIQNIKSSLFTNLDITPKESKKDLLVATHQKERRSEVIATPRVHKLPDISLMIVPQKITTTQRCYKDLGVFRNNTYKVGWAAGLTFYNNDPAAGSEVIYNLTHCRINVDNSRQYDCMMPNLIAMLEITVDESEFTLNNQIPTLHIKRDLSYLQRQTKLFNEHANTHSLKGQEKYLSSVWSLCSALWGTGDNSPCSRRQYLSDWLEKFTYNMSPDGPTKEHVLPDTEIFKTIFKLLSFYKVPEACKFALKHKMGRLAVLISQTTANERYKEWMQKYVDCYSWKEKDIILDEFKKVYLLLAGIPIHNGINICDGLDWMRNFGMHLWYIAPAAAPIDVSFNLYKKAFEESEYASKPIPPYCDTDVETTQYDLLYHIIGVYVDSTYQLCNVLHPETHTDNIMDYRLSWFMLQLFLSLKAGLIRESEKEYIHTTFATQLENKGHWKWAVIVLLYLKNDTLKKNLITKILERNVAPFTETVEIEKELVQKFKIPASWIHEVKATKTKAKGCYYDYFQHYIYMQDGQQANKAFIEHILPELFVNEQYDYLERFISELQPFSSRLVDWQTEAGLFQDYIDLQKNLSDEREEGPMITGGKLASLLRRVNCFPVKNEQQNLCVAELSRKCALLFKVLNKKVEQDEYYAKFIDLFKNLFMTPDIRHNEIFFLVTKSLKESSAV